VEIMWTRKRNSAVSCEWCALYRTRCNDCLTTRWKLTRYCGEVEQSFLFTFASYQLHLHWVLLVLPATVYQIRCSSAQYCFYQYAHSSISGVPRRQPHRRSGLATLPPVGAVP